MFKVIDGVRHEMSEAEIAEFEAKRSMTAEQKLNRLREERDILLMSTDVWALQDRTMTEEQTAYRQALRDITDTYTSLDDVVWPEKP